MIPLSEKKVKRSSGKSNTICENRRKNKSLVKYVLQKTPKACRCAPFLCPKRVQNAFAMCPPCAAARQSLVCSPRVSSRSSAQNACLCTRTCRTRSSGRPAKVKSPFTPASILFTLCGAYFPHRCSLYSAASSFVTALPRRYFTNAAASRAYFESVAALLPSAASARMYSRRHSAPLCPNAYLLQPFYPDNKPKIRSGARKAVENILTNHAGQTVDLRRDM